MKPPRIAVTGLARGENPQPGSALVRSIRRAWPDAWIVGLVYDALESGIFAEDRPDVTFTIPYPSSGKECLLERIDAILATSPFDILLPTLDAEIEPLLMMREAFASRNISLIIPDETSYHKRSKQNLAELCSESGLNTPKTIRAHSVSEAVEAAVKIGFPAYVKGPFYDAYQVFGTEGVRQRAHALLAEWGGPLLVQESKSGPEFNFIGVGDGEGGILARCSVRKTVVSSKGKGYGGVTIKDPELEAAAECLIAHLRWRGPFELEFLRDDSEDELFLLEMNPRFPAWADVPAQLGVNMGEIAIRQALGEPIPTPGDCPVGSFFLRHNIDIVGSSAEFGQLMATGTIHR